MATGTQIRTYFEGSWHDGDIPVMKAADHGAWLGSTVFDGARMVNGLVPDLRPHCARLNASAEALMIRPTHTVDQMVEIIRDGLSAYKNNEAVYIRPMYWALDGGDLMILQEIGPTGFAISLEVFPMISDDASASLGRTSFSRPLKESSLVNAKAGCLYPNNSRMLAEVRSRGFSNALVADIMGNVAESATSNVFMVKDGEVFTPAANGTFLSGITRARHISNLRADGVAVHEAVLTFDDFIAADEVFLSGNMMKVTPVSRFEETEYQLGPMTRRARSLYWDWARSSSAIA